MKTIRLKKLPLLGKVNPPYKQRRMTEDEMKRPDIFPNKLYLCCYDGVWTIGRFSMCWYGWFYNPNYGSFGVQVNDLEAIYEIIEGLDQTNVGSTANFIMEYLSKENNDNV